MRENLRQATAMWWVVLACALLAISVAGYQRLFSTFAAYDDEGYVMISLHSYLSGHALYDQTYSQYGPAYYVLQSLGHAGRWLPLTHDVTRFKTLFTWMLVAALGAWFVYRVTRRNWLALTTLLVGFVHLDRLAMEPGHPQELCLLAVTVGLLITTFLDATAHRLRWLCLLGGLVGVVAATKVNLGALLFLSLTMALLVLTTRGRPGTQPANSRFAKWIGWRPVLYALAALAALLPVVVTRAHLFSLAGCVLPLTSSISLWATLRVALSSPNVSSRHTPSNGDLPPAVTGRELIGFILGVMASFCIVSAIVVLHGTTLYGLWNGLVLQHLGAGQMFYAPAPISPLAVPWALVCLGLTYSDKRFRLAPLLAGFVVLAIMRQAVETIEPLAHGLQDRSVAGTLAGFAAPLVWVVLLRPTSNDGSDKTNLGSADDRFSFSARLCLCLVAVLQPLGAYPIPGTQMAIGSFAVLLACLIAVSDCWEMLRRPATGAWNHDSGLRTFAICSLMVVVAQAIFLWQVRAGYQPLAVYGANRLRRPADEVVDKRWLVATLRDRASSFLCAYEAKNSLYFWTRLEPPTTLNANYWPGMLDRDQQTRVAARFGTKASNCVVWQRDHRLEPAGISPLAEFLKTHYRPWRRQGAFEVWVSRSTTTDQLTSAGPG